jgi:hypothetical protein
MHGGVGGGGGGGVCVCMCVCVCFFGKLVMSNSAPKSHRKTTVELLATVVLKTAVWACRLFITFFFTGFMNDICSHCLIALILIS